MVEPNYFPMCSWADPIHYDYRNYNRFGSLFVHYPKNSQIPKFLHISLQSDHCHQKFHTKPSLRNCINLDLWLSHIQFIELSHLLVFKSGQLATNIVIQSTAIIVTSFFTIILDKSPQNSRLPCAILLRKVYSSSQVFSKV